MKVRSNLSVIAGALLFLFSGGCAYAFSGSYITGDFPMMLGVLGMAAGLVLAVSGFTPPK